jgi:hypothetical protein
MRPGFWPTDMIYKHVAAFVAARRPGLPVPSLSHCVVEVNAVAAFEESCRRRRHAVWSGCDPHGRSGSFRLGAREPRCTVLRTEVTPVASAGPASPTAFGTVKPQTCSNDPGRDVDSVGFPEPPPSGEANCLGKVAKEPM